MLLTTGARSTGAHGIAPLDVVLPETIMHTGGLTVIVTTAPFDYEDAGPLPSAILGWWSARPSIGKDRSQQKEKRRVYVRCNG